MTSEEKIRFLIETVDNADALKAALLKVTAPQSFLLTHSTAQHERTSSRAVDHARSDRARDKKRMSMPEVVQRIAATNTLPVSMSYMEVARVCGISGRSTSALGVYIKDGGGMWVTNGVRVTSKVAEGAGGRHMPTIYRFEKV